jgi:arylformamidase
MSKIYSKKKCQLLIGMMMLLHCLVMILLGTQLGLAQVQGNDIEIYNDINYYQDSVGVHDKAHLLDIYRPEGCHDCPVIVYIHGGTWVLGDKGGFSDKAKAFTSQNVVYLSINYRLSPDVQFPAHVQDVAQVFSWVKKNIHNYGGGPEQIFLLGHSAGGHLAALIALDKRYLTALNVRPSEVAGIIGLDSAAYHLPSLFSAEPENQYLFSWAFGEDVHIWEVASPLNYMEEGLNIPPFLLLVAGDREVSETVNQTFYEQLKQYGYDVTLYHFPDKDHVSIDYDLGKEDDPVFPIVIDWIQRVRKKGYSLFEEED